MDTNPQEEVAPEQEQVEGEKNQLLEIYKLHAQLAGDISNRQSTASRFYATLISAILVIFFSFLQHKDNLLPGDPSGNIALGYSMLIVGYLGALLSLIWAFSIRFYNTMNRHKYEVLKKLEAKLEYQFFAQEWKHTDKRIQGIPYELISKTVIYIPYAFLLLFIILTVVGLLLSAERVSYLLKHIFNG